jgi:hypothetical protein
MTVNRKINVIFILTQNRILYFLGLETPVPLT